MFVCKIAFPLSLTWLNSTGSCFHLSLLSHLLYPVVTLLVNKLTAGAFRPSFICRSPATPPGHAGSVRVRVCPLASIVSWCEFKPDLSRTEESSQETEFTQQTRGTGREKTSLKIKWSTAQTVWKGEGGRMMAVIASRATGVSTQHWPT